MPAVSLNILGSIPVDVLLSITLPVSPVKDRGHLIRAPLYASHVKHRGRPPTMSPVELTQLKANLNTGASVALQTIHSIIMRVPSNQSPDIGEHESNPREIVSSIPAPDPLHLRLREPIRSLDNESVELWTDPDSWEVRVYLQSLNPTFAGTSEYLMNTGEAREVHNPPIEEMFIGISSIRSIYYQRQPCVPDTVDAINGFLDAASAIGSDVRSAGYMVTAQSTSSKRDATSYIRTVMKAKRDRPAFALWSTRSPFIMLDG